MSERLQTCQCNKSTTNPSFSNHSKLLDKNRKPLVSRPPLIQTKLTINQPGDEYEQEADRVAEQVMRMPDPVSVPQSSVYSQPERLSIQSITHYPEKEIQRKEDDEEEKEIVQMKQGSLPYTAASKNAPPIVHEVLSSPGLLLDQATRAYMEPRFEYDFSRVRVHLGPAAEQSARSINAHAYTVGSDIVFGAGGVSPGTQEGRRLIAHELTHVRQDALADCPGTQLRRTPCPSCHKPEGTQQVTLEELHDDDVYYLPDQNASMFFEYMNEGFYWGTYNGGTRKRARSIRYYNYDGSSQIVGYVLDFKNPMGSNFPQPVVVIDVYGNMLKETTIDPQALESVISPIDFIGPGLLSRPFISGTRTLAGGVAKTAHGVAKTAQIASATLGRSARNLAFATRVATAKNLGAAMQADFSALATPIGASSSFVVRGGSQFTFGSTQTGRVAAGIAESAPALPTSVTQGAIQQTTAQAGTQAAVQTSRRVATGVTESAPALPTSAVQGAIQQTTAQAGTQAAVRTAAQAGVVSQVAGEEVFQQLGQELGLEVPGTIRYPSTAAAARAARATGLGRAVDVEFQTHATAPSIREEFDMSGRVWQSAHIVPQAVYRALRALGMPFSEDRALTTLLPRQAHAAFDRTWITEWKNAVAAGRPIRAGDVYNWVSRAINSVDDSLINVRVKGAINDRLHTELFVELGLDPSFIIIP